jgi:hypothetical protein
MPEVPLIELPPGFVPKEGLEEEDVVVVAALGRPVEKWLCGILVPAAQTAKVVVWIHS